MEIKKALTLRASSIGDCLMGKYLLDNIHAQYPRARLGLVVGSRAAMLRDLFADYPYIEVVEANRRNPASLLRLLRDWRGSDLVVTQYAGKPGGRFSLGSKLMARLLAKKLVGFSDASKFNSFLYDNLVTLDINEAPAELERRALRAAGLKVPLPYPALSAPEPTDVLKKFGLTAGAYVPVHLFSGGKNRSLGPAKRRELLAALAAALPGVTLLVTGSAAEASSARDIANGLPVRVIAGEVSLQELMSLIAQSAVVVSVDTGVAHMAAQLGAPLVVLTSCVGAHWWQDNQYGNNPRVQVFSNPEPGGHVAKDYPDCIGTIDFAAAARVASNFIKR